MSLPIGGVPSAGAPIPGAGGRAYDVSQIPPVPAPQPAPAVPQPGQPQPGFASAPQPQPAPQPNLQLVNGGQGQPAVPQGADLNQVLQGDSVPVELRGRTLGEVLGMTTAMRRVIQQGNIQPQPQPAPQPTLQQVPSNSSMQTPQQAAQAAAEFFRDPQRMMQQSMIPVLQDMLPKILGPYLAPITQNAIQSQASGAMQQIINEVGPQRFQTLFPHMQEYLTSVPAQALTNPETWRLAARAAAGQMVLATPAQQAQPQPQQGAQPQQGFGTPASPFPVQMVGPGGQPVPGLPTFFTETPNGGPANGRVQLTPLQEQVRQAMGYDYDTYVAWLGGVQPQQGRR